jgi:hypothetical protein
MQFGPQDANGVRQVTIPASGMQFDPIVINPPIGDPIRVCVTAEGTDGSGKIDCNGGESDLDIITRQDHNTTNPPGSNGGLPQDPECDDTRTAPDGEVSSACLESSVTTCNANDPHLGACNSPVEFVPSGAYASGDLRIVEYLHLRLVEDVGPDGLQCTGDDTYSPPAFLRAFFTTGTARATVYDTNNVDNSLLDHQGVGCSNCITQVTGVPRACNLITGSGGVRNLKFVGALPILDVPDAGDAAATIEVDCQ